MKGLLEAIEAKDSEASSFVVFHPVPRNVSKLEGYVKFLEDGSAAHDVGGNAGRRRSLQQDAHCGMGASF